MIKCWKYLYTEPKYGDLKIYKFSDDEFFETPVDATNISKEKGFFITKEELEQLQREAFEAGKGKGQLVKIEGSTSYRYKTFEEYLSSKSKEGK